MSPPDAEAVAAGQRRVAGVTRALNEIVRARGQPALTPTETPSGAKAESNLREALRVSEERYRLMVEQVRDVAIFMLDEEGRIATWNSGARRIKGYEPLEVLGQPLDIFYTPEDQASGKPRRLLGEAAERGSVQDEGWRMRKDGSRFWASIVLTALFDADRKLTGFAKVTRDLTEKHEKAQAERLAHERHIELEKLKELHRFKNEFIGLSAHELNTPLTPLSTIVHLLEEAPLNPEQVRHYLQVLKKNLARLQRLVQDLLDASRLDRPGFALERRLVEIGALVADAARLFETQAKERRLQFHLDLPGGLLARVDGERISQVVVNLISNAIKFSNDGGDVFVSARREAEGILLDVRDTGVGIEPEFMPRLFEPFSRSARPGPRRPGSGLGLYVSRAIVERHGGHLVAASAGPGRGATFRMTLPMRPEATLLKVPLEESKPAV